MITVFIDTNIFLDLILQREPFSVAAKNLFSLCSKKEIQGFTSALSILTTTYFIKKAKPADYRAILLYVLSYIRVIPTTHENLIAGLQSAFTDPEDAYQYFTAKNKTDVDYIVTRNKKDFKNSTIKAILPEEFFKLM